MTTPTVTVTIDLGSLGGEQIEDVVITARMDKTDWYDGFVIAGSATATTDASGIATMELFPNALATDDPPGLGTTGSIYRFTASIPNSRPLDVRAVVPNGDVDLHAIVMSDDEERPGSTGGSVRWDVAQSLTSDQQTLARSNIGFVAAVRATVLTGIDLVTATAVTAADTVMSAIGKLWACWAALSTATGAASTGAGLVGVADGTLLDAYLRNKVGQVVDNLTALRAIDKTKFTRALVLGFAAVGDNGGGVFYYDSADAATADNGGTVVVATDNGRWKRVFSGEVDVLWFGADKTGGTNAKSAFDAAIATGYDVFVPKGTFLLNSGITLSTGQTLRGAGWQSILRYTANGRGVTLAQRSTIRDLKIQGDGAAAVGKASQTGILAATSAQEFLIHNVWLQDIAGDYATTGAGAIYIAILTHANFEGGRISSCLVTDCDSGYVLADAGEYVTMTNCLANRNVVGIRVTAGNLLASGCHFSGNTINLSMDSGSNEAHGTFSACSFNHGGTANAQISNIRYGMQFLGCQFHSGHITLTDTIGVAFVGGQIVGAGFTFTLAGTCTNTLISSCRFPEPATATAMTQTLNGNALTKANNLNF